jgi:hypothetical protein
MRRVILAECPAEIKRSAGGPAAARDPFSPAFRTHFITPSPARVNLQGMNTTDQLEVETLSPVESTAAPWVTHFRDNLYRDWGIPWDCNVTLSESIRARAASIAEFQRGESSEAIHYLAKSEKFARRQNDPDFHAASILFVREENAHAALLLRFMRLAEISQRKRVFSDGVFRQLRAVSDLGWSSRVLIIAELIAQEYYPCLREATSHPVLRRICDKIICDEEAHIRFQVERIARLEASLPSWKVAVRDGAQTVLMVGAAVVVILGHRRVLVSRVRLVEFLRNVLARNRGAIRALHNECGVGR